MIDYSTVLNQRIQAVPPSAIRKFFDILEEMPDAISLGIGEPDFVTRGISATRAFALWRRAAPNTPPTGAFRSCADRSPSI